MDKFISQNDSSLKKKKRRCKPKGRQVQNNLYEAELDYYYLSSPKIISKKIIEFSDEEYSSIDYSRIYFSLEQFLNEKEKTTQSFINEKKIKKK